MKYKAKVLRRFPDAKPVVVTRAYDLSPNHVSIHANGMPIDIYDSTDQQLYGAAWRSAYYWMVRNPVAGGGG